MDLNTDDTLNFFLNTNNPNNTNNFFHKDLNTDDTLFPLNTNNSNNTNIFLFT